MREARRRRRRAAGRCSSTTRSTSSTPRARPASQGRDAEPPQHPQQRLFRRRGLRLHRARPGLHPGAVLPLLRHGPGQPGLHQRTARAWSMPGETFDPLAVARGRRRPSAARRSTACRRCSSPSSTIRRFGEFDLSTPAHRHHGRLAVPDRADAAGGRREMHMPEIDHRLRHDRDIAGVHADAAATTRWSSRVGTVGRVQPHVEIKHRRPGDGRDRAARRGRRAAACAATRHARLLERPGRDRGRDRRRRLDALRRPGDDGRRRLRHIVGRHQGHDHPRRREHLPARDRGVPAHAPGVAEVQVVGVPDAEVRRGADGLDRAARWRGAERRMARLPRQDRHHKIPRYGECVDGYPRDITGKVQKFKLREQAIGRFGLAEVPTPSVENHQRAGVPDVRTRCRSQSAPEYTAPPRSRRYPVKVATRLINST